MGGANGIHRERELHDLSCVGRLGVVHGNQIMPQTMHSVEAVCTKLNACCADCHSVAIGALSIVVKVLHNSGAPPQPLLTCRLTLGLV